MPTNEPDGKRGGIDRRDLFRALGIGGLGAMGVGGLAGGAAGQQQEVEIEYVTILSEETGQQRTEFVDVQGNVACVLVGVDAGAQVVDPPHPLAYQVVIVRRREDGMPDVVTDVFEDGASAAYAGMVTLDRGGQAEVRECFGVASLGPKTEPLDPNDYEAYVTVTDLVAGTTGLASKQFTVGPGSEVAPGNGTAGNETVAVTDVDAGNATTGNATDLGG